MMTLIEAYNKSLKYLKNPEQEEIVLRIFLCEINDLNSMSDFYIKRNENIKDLQRFNDFLQRFLNGEPVEYILGKCNFYGLNFIVNKDVLIPRPETEELVEIAIKEIKKNNYKKVVDVCCGSGCIGLSIFKNTEIDEIVLSDISKRALNIARLNAKNLNIDKAKFYKADGLSFLKENIDLIVGNPPYILSKNLVDKSVLENEPNIALFVNEKITIYRNIISKGVECGAKLILLEIGDEIVDLLRNYLDRNFKQLHYNFIKDINNKNRIISIRVA